MIFRTTPLWRALTIGSLAAAVAVGLPAPAAHAYAPGCNATYPTAIGGPIYGYGGTYNNWSVRVQVGIDLANSAGQKVDVDGTVITDPTRGYSAIDWVNPTLTQPGAASGYERQWGKDASNDYLCVSSKVVTAFFEIYPKSTNPANGQYVTDKTYYGMSIEQHNPVTAGATNTYTLRIPTADAYGGNTGDLNGYITYQGQRVDPASLTFRVWPNQTGPTCGVQGGAFSADELAYSQSLNATYYNVKHLAGGQCGAASQSYDLEVRCANVCGGTLVKRYVTVSIADGTRPRVDVAF